jgi:hypothetical protein
MGCAPMAFAFSKQNTTWVRVPKVKVKKTKEIQAFIHGE